MIPMLLMAAALASTDAAPAGARDFDWEIGRWKTHLRRRLHPLSGSDEWVEYEGTTNVAPVWNGAANLVELDVSGPRGRIEGLSLRLFEPGTREWTLNFANRASGELSPPSRGAFHDGRGEFLSHETFDGKPILVRFVITVVGRDEARFEQAFSADDGKTWVSNWIAVDTRVR